MSTNLFTQEEKDFLIENGYLIFNFEEKAPEESEVAKKVLKEFIETKSFDKLVLSPRTAVTADDMDYIKSNFQNIIYNEDAGDVFTGNEDEIDELIKYTFRNGPNAHIAQIWKEGPQNRGLSLFHKLRLTISEEIYNYNRGVHRPQNGVITAFSKNCRINKHTDTGEGSKRLCVLTFYLNEKSEAEGNGGELVLVSKKGEEIVIPPYMGTAVILDFAGNDGVIRNNLNHEVTMVKNDFIRYTYLSGIAL